MTSAQQAHWSAAKLAANKLVDGRAMPIDEGILETVAILHVIGVNTVVSCEGHSDRGYAPYVSLEAPQANADRARIAAYRKTVRLATR